MNKIILKRKEEKRILSGHPWIFSNEIESVETEQPYDLYYLFSSRNDFLGVGVYNSHSLIAFRMLSYKPIEDIRTFLYDKLHIAYSLRKQIFQNQNSFRLVFGESDFLPGVIIDKYNDTFVLQFNSRGMEHFALIIAEILINNFGAKNVFTKNDAGFRTLENAEIGDRIFFGEMGKECIEIDGIHYNIDFSHAQKTGFYFDQQINRTYASQFCRDKKVADIYCNAGGFGMQALKQGAQTVTFVDSSAFACAEVEENLQLNKFETLRCEIINQDAFEWFQKSIAENVKYDIVMVDPPSFTKNKKGVFSALRAYEKLHRYALSCLNDESWLITSSCSFHINKQDFIETVSSAAAKVKRKIQLIHSASAAPDHPILPQLPETDYLKFLVFRVTN